MSVLVGKKAPKFSATAVVNGSSVERNFSIEQFIGKKYVLLFFYTKDFSGICPSELYDFQERLEKFKEKNVEVIGCSPLAHIPPTNLKISLSKKVKASDISLIYNYCDWKNESEYDYNGVDNLNEATIDGNPPWQIFNLIYDKTINENITPSGIYNVNPNKLVISDLINAKNNDSTFFNLDLSTVTVVISDSM